jgi:curli production assembly/transport component CsgG
MVARLVAVTLTLLLLTGCAGTAIKEVSYDPPAAIPTGVKELEKLPPIDGPIITIAVYGFGDKTGQRKPNPSFSQLSTAVTQGADNWVIQALQKAGSGTWFKVLERASLDNLVKERQLIRSTREIYDKDKGIGLKPMLFAGLLVDGAIVGYDSNVTSGGVGARYFGIGANRQYRTDRVSIAMRIISVQTGEILLAVSVDKTIASYKDGADVFRFLDLGTKALEVEIGSAVNEPVNYAVRVAIEQAVVELVKTGEKKGLWKFKEVKAKPALQTEEIKKVKKVDLPSTPDAYKFNVCNDAGWCFQSMNDLESYEKNNSKGADLAHKLHDKDLVDKSVVKSNNKGQQNNDKGDNQ